jgi:hypothetical protein
MLSVIILNVILPNVIMLNVIMTNVAAPKSYSFLRKNVANVNTAELYDWSTNNNVCEFLDRLLNA